MIETKKFKNGLRALVAPMKSTEAVTILILVGTGSVYETKNISGVSHFLEHLFFKGTALRSRPGQVAREMDGLGAEHNAFTSKEITGFWIKSSHRHFDRALEIIADLLLNPLFKPEEIEKERGVILQEISMYEDMPQRNVWEVFDELMYGNQPAGWNIAGTVQSIKGISRNNIVGYKQKQYVPANTLAVVAGNVSPKRVFSKINDLFLPFSPGRPEKMPKVIFKQKGPRVKIKHKETDQTHLVLGVQGYDMFDSRRYILNLLSVILGGNMSSRLFMEIREKLGLAYYVGTQISFETYGGYFTANAGVPHASLEKTVKKIAEILKRAAANGVSAKELKLAKDYARGTMALSFESSDEVASFYGEQAFFQKKILSPEEIWQKMEKFSRDDLARAARDLFHPSRFNLAIIGPHQDADFYQKLLEKSAI
ncbi:MAG: insulinase family protein [Candidatus Niyogibacteria bacterium]|nr:insulinase family protein [Candidatus Niyogibacteria bacterium]